MELSCLLQTEPFCLPTQWIIVDCTSSNSNDCKFCVFVCVCACVGSICVCLRGAHDALTLLHCILFLVVHELLQRECCETEENPTCVDFIRFLDGTEVCGRVSAHPHTQNAHAHATHHRQIQLLSICSYTGFIFLLLTFLDSLQSSSTPTTTVTTMKHEYVTRRAAFLESLLTRYYQRIKEGSRGR